MFAFYSLFQVFCLTDDGFGLYNTDVRDSDPLKQDFVADDQDDLKIAVEGGETTMSEIRVKENETLDSALRRFKRSCARSGVLAEVRKREHYEKPSVRRKKKSEAARKRKR